MTTQAYPTVNEVAPSWSDISIVFALLSGPTIRTVDISGIKWSDTVEVGDWYGANNGRRARRTTGKYSCEASATMAPSACTALEEALAEANPKIALVPFDVIVQHTPPGSVEIFTTKIVGCRYLGRSADMAEGVDADVLEITLNPTRIERASGISLL